MNNNKIASLIVGALALICLYLAFAQARKIFAKKKELSDMRDQITQSENKRNAVSNQLVRLKKSSAKKLKFYQDWNKSLKELGSSEKIRASINELNRSIVSGEGSVMQTSVPQITKRNNRGKNFFQAKVTVKLDDMAGSFSSLVNYLGMFEVNLPTSRVNKFLLKKNTKQGKNKLISSLIAEVPLLEK